MQRIEIETRAVEASQSNGLVKPAAPRPVVRGASIAPHSPWLAAETPGEFSLYVPLHYEPNHAYPLVVWLHDNGLKDSDVVEAIATMSLRNYVAVGPRGTEQCVADGYGWIQSAQAIEATEQVVHAAIDAARSQLNIHTEKIFIAGIGHGGTMAFRVAFRQPERFTGVATLNGPLPDGMTPLSHLRRCRRLPVFWTQCAAHHFFDDAQLDAHLKLLFTAGFDVTLRQYPASENCRDMILADANRWLMGHVTDALVA